MENLGCYASAHSENFGARLRYVTNFNVFTVVEKFRNSILE